MEESVKPIDPCGDIEVSPCLQSDGACRKLYCLCFEHLILLQFLVFQFWLLAGIFCLDVKLHVQLGPTYHLPYQVPGCINFLIDVGHTIEGLLKGVDGGCSETRK